MNEKQYVVFKLEQEYYGLDIMHVKEISEFEKCNKIPHTPSYIEGILNYRGVVTPLINLRKKFCMPVKKNESESQIIIINLEDKQLGFLVDEAFQILTINQNLIEPSPKILETNSNKFIEGVAKMQEWMVILLDIKKILSENEKKTIFEIQ